MSSWLRRYWTALVGVATVGAVAVVAAVSSGTSPPDGPRPGPSVSVTPSPTPGFERAAGPSVVVDQTPTGDRFPGGAIRLSARNGGRWLVVYQRYVGDVAEVFARETDRLLGPYGPEALVSDPSLGSAYDPNAVEFPDGRVIVTWTNARVIWYAERLSRGRFGLVRELFGDPGGSDFEQTMAILHGRRSIVYDHHPYGRKAFLWDPRVRVLSSDPRGVSVGPPVTVVRNGPGYGTEGTQKRVTLSETGAESGAVAVWAQHAAVPCVVPTDHPGSVQNCGPRPIFAALSGDGGSTWGLSREIASVPGHDLVNPFAILLAPEDLRVYFTVDRNVPDVGYVRSDDHGATWGAVHYVLVPQELTAARMLFLDTPDEGLVGLFTSQGFASLVAVRIEEPGA